MWPKEMVVESRYIRALPVDAGNRPDVQNSKPWLGIMHGARGASDCARSRM